jgi:bifunctional DNA-binding transcriptional regulator/antitoxin component of YhaV-PrlF toxin-antitoxin module
MDRVTNMKRRMKTTRGGQISIPAEICHRWGTSDRVLDDQGDRVVLEPVADDPVAAAEGALADVLGGVDLADLRRRARQDERVAERRRRR